MEVIPNLCTVANSGTTTNSRGTMECPQQLLPGAPILIGLRLHDVLCNSHEILPYSHPIWERTGYRCQDTMEEGHIALGTVIP